MYAAEYFLSAAAHSVRLLHLYEQVLGCVARRQLTPAMLREALGELPAPDSQTPLARFVEGLTQLATRSEAARREYHAQLVRLAGGEITPAEFRRTTGTQFNRAFAEELNEAARLWFALLGDLDDARARVTDDYLLGMLRKINPMGFDTDVIELVAAPGAIASRALSLENTRDTPAMVRCSVSDVRRADGVARAFIPDLAITPAEFHLDRQATVRLSLRLDESVYDRDVPYIGAFHVMRGDEPPFDLPLRITARNAP